MSPFTKKGLRNFLVEYVFGLHVKIIFAKQRYIYSVICCDIYLLTRHVNFRPLLLKNVDVSVCDTVVLI